MRAEIRRFLVAVLALAAMVWPAGAPALAQGPGGPGDLVAEVGSAVAKEPDRSVQIVVDAVASHQPKDAPVIVAAAVGALAPPQRKALAPAIVAAAIRALPSVDRVPLAPGCACAAIRVIPKLEQREVVPPVVAAAVNTAPEARPRITECAIDAAPGLVAEINAVVAAAAAPLPLVDADATTGSPLPGGSVGRDALDRLRCASPPCPG